MQKIKFLYKSFLFIFFSMLTAIIGLYTHAYFSKPIKLNASGNYFLYDDKDNLIYQGSSINEWTDLKNISSDLINAVISIEDKNFFQHHGFDYLRIGKAMFKNIINSKIVEGASTISQQYIKNAYLDFKQTWNRKIKEAFLTLNLEVHYSKNEILEAYLNTINYGQGNYGIQSASKFYFNKNAKDLSLEEAIILSGIPKNPSNYNPVSHYDSAIKRAKTVAFSMYKNNFINEETYNNLFKKEIKIYGKKSDKDLQTLMYYQDAVINELKKIPNISEEQINSGNLKVYTTLNYETQKIMEEEIINNLPNNKLEVASVIINPNTGEILALSGGVNYAKSQYNRAIYSKRQVGSTMKPFLYYAALNNGMTSSSTFKSQFTLFNMDNGKIYSPKNYGNVYGNKEITMATAISYSDNIYAVKTNLFLGVDELINTAKLCGIKEKLKEVPSLALGTSEINLLDFAQGYTTFASGGYYRKNHLIRKVIDENGNILYEAKKSNNLVLNPNYTYILNELLTSTTNEAFLDYNTPTALSIAKKLDGKYAIKTGTTDTDYWTIGYNPNRLMVMWMGYDDNSFLEVSIGGNAKNIFANTINKISNNDNSWYHTPNNVVGLLLNAIDGTPTSDINKANMFYYLKGSEPEYDITNYIN